MLRHTIDAFRQQCYKLLYQSDFYISSIQCQENKYIRFKELFVTIKSLLLNHCGGSPINCNNRSFRGGKMSYKILLFDLDDTLLDFGANETDSQIVSTTRIYFG